MKHSDTKRSIDSTANAASNKIRHAAVVLAALGALSLSAVAGAWAQAHFSAQPAPSADQQRMLSQQAARDSAYLRQNVSVLASKVGDLQARVITMNGLSKRVAEAAGVSYSDPEIHNSLDQSDVTVMDYLGEDDNAVWTAESVGRKLDTLQQQLASQQEGLTMLDVVLTRRAGTEASLPTFMPVDYPWLSSSFGWRRNPVTGRHSMHEGLDFAAPKGTPIMAASGGVVVQAKTLAGYGKTVEIDHGNGLLTRYAHASSLLVKPGDLVEKGQMVARVGSTGRSTGAHLHFEVRMADYPLDPTLFLAGPDTQSQLLASAPESVQASKPQVR